MKLITLKYAGQCRKCGAELGVGAQAMHERRAGVWCLGCAPTDTEEIREIRQESAERRADRLEEWAEKHQAKAEALIGQNEPYRGDVAFNTQPGHIPERARAIRRSERAFEEQRTANAQRAKANSIRSGVRVKGDREREREAQREQVRAWIKPGMRVETAFYGSGTVLRVNRKTATIDAERGRTNEDLSWLSRFNARPEDQ